MALVSQVTPLIDTCVTCRQYKVILYILLGLSGHQEFGDHSEMDQNSCMYLRFISVNRREIAHTVCLHCCTSMLCIISAEICRLPHPEDVTAILMQVLQYNSDCSSMKSRKCTTERKIFHANFLDFPDPEIHP